MSTLSTEQVAEVTSMLDVLVKKVVSSTSPSVSSSDTNSRTVVYAQEPLTIILRQDESGEVMFDAAAFTNPRGFLEVIDVRGKMSIVTDTDTFNVIPSVHPEVYDNVVEHFRTLAEQV